MDFVCCERKLVIELDRASHFTEQGKAYDQERSAYLEGLGVQVLRFSNLEVMSNLEGVCKEVLTALNRYSIQWVATAPSSGPR
jgi:very-short-patch-repair endonuclease